jgi:S-adenosylmethionine-dependent methyltransferase
VPTATVTGGGDGRAAWPAPRLTAVRADAVYRALTTEVEAARTRGVARPRVLDVGGGSGVWAVPLAVAGCEVTVVDPSPDALAVLRRRATEAGCAERVLAMQGDTDMLSELVDPGSADLVLAHGVLEVVDDVDAAVAALATATTPGGVLSVLVANRFAAVIGWAVAGRLTDARLLLDDPNGCLVHRDDGGTDALRRRLDASRLDTMLTAAGLRVELLQGDGVLAELVPAAVFDGSPGAADALAALELRAAVTPPLRDVASRLHAMARR